MDAHTARTSTGPVRKIAWGSADGGAHPRTAPSSFPSCPADASPGWQPGIARRHARETALRGLPSTPRRADTGEEEPAAPWEVTANSHASIARAIEASCSRAVHMSVGGRRREQVACFGDFDKLRPAPRLLRGDRSRLAASRQHQNDRNVVSHWRQRCALVATAVPLSGCTRVDDLCEQKPCARVAGNWRGSDQGKGGEFAGHLFSHISSSGSDPRCSSSARSKAAAAAEGTWHGLWRPPGRLPWRRPGAAGLRC